MLQFSFTAYWRPDHVRNQLAVKIGDSGIICFVNNSAFLDSLACDGVRENLAKAVTYGRSVFR